MMDDFLSTTLESMVGDWEEITCKEVESIDEYTYLCHLIIKVEDPEDLSIMVSFYPRGGTLSVSALLGTDLPHGSIWQLLDGINAKLNSPGSGFIGKLSVRPMGYDQKEGFVDLIYSWEIGVTPSMCHMEDLKIILLEQMIRVASDTRRLLAYILSSVPGRMH